MGQAKHRGTLADRTEEALFGVRPLNYSTHAIGDLTRLANEHELRPKRNGAEGLWFLQSVLTLRGVIEQIRDGEKFLLPKDALLLDAVGMKESYRDLLRLPYPITVLEFPTSLNRNGGSTKCLVLASTGGEWLDPTDIDAAFEVDQIDEIISFTTFFWSERQSAWLPTPFLYWFHRDHISIGGSKGIKAGAYGFYWKSLYPSIFSGLNGDVLDEQNDRDFQIGMDAIVEFCLSVNCENVDQYVLPSPRYINQKRANSGREAFDSYRVLVIGGDKHDSRVGGGSHASPRLHLRRGHLRRLPSGRVTWVRHSIVGDADSGVAEKSYRVTAQQAIK